MTDPTQLDSQTSDKQSESVSELSQKHLEKEDPEAKGHTPASERVREGWDALPGDEQAVDYTETDKSVPENMSAGMSSDEFFAHLDSQIFTVELRVRLGKQDVDLTEYLENGDHAEVLEALDRLQTAVIAWLDVRAHHLALKES